MAIALTMSLLSVAGLTASGGTSMSLLFFVLAGMSLSHVLPLVFALVRDTVRIREQGCLIADAVIRSSAS
ncbi:hypothetical protein NKI51_09070 [Mesorhizobium australicum]|uniref:hypothetical protein n=1 Tax=Mesorhizobium australicum TaxID=536018 RepID=UPI00333CD38A